MAYCRNCGNEVDDRSTTCPSCGQPTKSTPTTYQSSISDNGGFLWGLLGFCVPIAGLVIYLIWKEERPNNAKAAGTGALVSVILGVVFYIFAFVLAGIAGAF
jgi:hypothetical protein